MVWTHTRAKRRLSGAVPRPSRAPAPAPGWLVVAFQWRDPEAGPVPNRFVPAPRTGKPPDSSSRLSHPVLLVRVQLREGAGPRAIRPRTSRRLALLALPTAATPPPRRSCPSTAPPASVVPGLGRPQTGAPRRARARGGSPTECPAGRLPGVAGGPGPSLPSDRLGVPPFGATSPGSRPPEAPRRRRGRQRIAGHRHIIAARGACERPPSFLFSRPPFGRDLRPSKTGPRNKGNRGPKQRSQTTCRQILGDQASALRDRRETCNPSEGRDWRASRPAGAGARARGRGRGPPGSNGGGVPPGGRRRRTARGAAGRRGGRGRRPWGRRGGWRGGRGKQPHAGRARARGLERGGARRAAACGPGGRGDRPVGLPGRRRGRVSAGLPPARSNTASTSAPPPRAARRGGGDAGRGASPAAVPPRARLSPRRPATPPFGDSAQGGGDEPSPQFERKVERN